MAILNVSPTRMSLLQLRKQLSTAVRGHKLLKEKRDGLMKQFMAIIREARALRLQIETEIGSAFTDFVLASSVMDPRVLEGSIAFSEASIDLSVSMKNVMSVQIPTFSIQPKGNLITYGFSNTSGVLDIALKKFQRLLPLLLRLAEIEKTAESLADEIEKTRRRVNALKHILIENFKETITFITMKLEESERGVIVGTMRTKSLMKEKEENENK